MTVQDLENIKPGDIPRIDLETMPVLAEATFRIPVNLGEDHDHRGMYKATAVPVNLPNGHKGYYLSVIRRYGDNGEYLSIIWTETLKLKEGGFVPSNNKHHREHFPNEGHSDFSSYYHICATQFMLRLNIAVFRPAPEKITIKLIGPFAETY